jgi:acetyltransferase
MVLVAERAAADGAPSEIVGVGRLMGTHGQPEGEFAILVADAWQRRGIGTALLGDLVEIGRREGMRRIVGDILETNTGMLHVSRRLGFDLHHDADTGAVRAELEVEPTD